MFGCERVFGFADHIAPLLDIKSQFGAGKVQHSEISWLLGLRSVG
jgi:hypothetical protein